MSEFSDKLGALVAMEAAKNDPEVMGEIIERLLYQAAFTISIASGGDRERMEAMLSGAESYLATTAVGFEDFSALMAKHGLRNIG